MKEWGEAGIFSQMTLFVEETCRLFQYGMEWEDCLQTGWLALEEARKSYPREMCIRDSLFHPHRDPSFSSCPV